MAAALLAWRTTAAAQRGLDWMMAGPTAQFSTREEDHRPVSLPCILPDTHTAGGYESDLASRLRGGGTG